VIGIGSRNVVRRTVFCIVAVAVCGLIVPATAQGAYEDVYVIGAGTAAVNGRYGYDNMFFGKPAYTMGGSGLAADFAIYWFHPGGHWRIEAGGSRVVHYANDEDSPTPPPTGWYVVSGDAPAPTVSSSPGCRRPILSGTPASTVVAGASYRFSPAVSEGCPPFTYSIVDKPSWASFSTALGGLFGTPDGVDVGVYEAITITVHDAEANTDTIGPFSITVALGEAAPAGAGDDGSFFDTPLDLPEGEEPPMIGTIPLAATFEIGEPITGGCRLLDAHGDAILGSSIEVKLCRVILGTPEELEEVIRRIFRYDAEEGCYRFELETDELPPGIYDVRLVLPDGSEKILRVRLDAPQP